MQEIEAGAQGVPFGKVVIQFPQVQLLRQGARNLSPEARQQAVDSGALRGSGRRLHGGAGVGGHAATVPGLGGAVDRGGVEAAGHGEVAPRHFAAQEVEQLVLDDGPAHGAAKLVALLRGREGGERIARVEPGAAVEPEASAVDLVAAALGHGVDHAAHGAAVLGRKVRGHHLEFLHRVLRNLRGDARSAGVLVVVLLGGIGAVHQE